MNHHPTILRRVTTERVVGFSAAVRSLGKHEVCGTMTYYSPHQVRQVLRGKHKSEKMLNLIANKCPEMFEVCNACDEVKAWYEDFKKESYDENENYKSSRPSEMER